MAQPIIHKRRDAFRRLMSRIKEVFLEKMNEPTLQTGRHNLLTEQDQEAIYYESNLTHQFKPLTRRRWRWEHR